MQKVLEVILTDEDTVFNSDDDKKANGKNYVNIAHTKRGKKKEVE